MRKSENGVEIKRVDNGFIVRDNEGNVTVIQEGEGDSEIGVAEQLLWNVIEFFGLRGSRHDRERISVIRKAGDKYIPQKGEKMEKEFYCVIGKKQKRV